MPSVENNPRIYQLPRSPLRQELSAFLIDRQARNLSPRTVDYYAEKLERFREFLESQAIADVHNITPHILRRYLLHLGETHNSGGVHAHYRAIKAFLRWWEAEVEPENWSNPLSKVAAPRVVQEPLPPISLEDLRAMLKTCERKTYTGDRDRALILFLLDTGVRRAEMCALNWAT